MLGNTCKDALSVILHVNVTRHLKEQLKEGFSLTSDLRGYNGGNAWCGCMVGMHGGMHGGVHGGDRWWGCMVGCMVGMHGDVCGLKVGSRNCSRLGG